MRPVPGGHIRQGYLQVEPSVEENGGTGPITPFPVPRLPPALPDQRGSGRHRLRRGIFKQIKVSPDDVIIQSFIRQAGVNDDIVTYTAEYVMRGRNISSLKAAVDIMAAIYFFMPVMLFGCLSIQAAIEDVQVYLPSLSTPPATTSPGGRRATP